MWSAQAVRKLKIECIQNFNSVGPFVSKILVLLACPAGSDGSMSASGSAGPEFDPRRGSKFSFENFQPRG